MRESECVCEWRKGVDRLTRCLLVWADAPPLPTQQHILKKATKHLRVAEIENVTIQIEKDLDLVAMSGVFGFHGASSQPPQQAPPPLPSSLAPPPPMDGAHTSYSV